MWKRNGELNGQNCEVLWRWQVAPWLTHRVVERTHCVLYSFPLSFSFRKRPNRAQQVNVKKCERTPLWSAFSDPDNGPAHLLYSCIKTLIKVLPVSVDWGCKAKTNKNPHCWGQIMTGPHLQSTGFKWLVGFCFLSRCVSVFLWGSVCVLEEERGCLIIPGGLQTDSSN